MRRKRADSQKSVVDLNEAPKGLPSRTWAMHIKKVYELKTVPADALPNDLRRERYFDDRLEVSLRDMPVSLGRSGHAGLVWGICGLRPYLHSRERNNPGVKTEKTMNLTGTEY